MKINEILSCYKADDINALCKKITGYDLNEKNLNLDKIKEYWNFVGDNPSNASVINMLKKGEKGLIERITNGIDAVIEKQVNKMDCIPISAGKVIQKAFPKYFAHCADIRRGDSIKNNACDAADQVIVAVSDGSRSSRPTFDVVDKGTGITGDNFSKTILSINKGNKLSKDKQYLIGAFGQGGSTSLSFAYATIIISKISDQYFFTIVKQVDLSDYKNVAYVYLTIDGKIPTLERDSEFEEKWINSFIESESGTFIRMIEMDISQDIAQLDAAKPRGLADFINTELFNVGLPVTVIENRKNYQSNEHAQNRISYGSDLKLCTWKTYVKDDYSGTTIIDFNNKAYQVHFYAILPEKEEEWSSDSKCRDVFEQINIYDDPIIYTVNGQTVSTEGFTKIKNSGLTQLKYRLLVVINLDLLGKDKYKFFTTDRSQIKVNDDSRGLLDEIVLKISSEEKLRDLNSKIASLSLNKGIDDEKQKIIANKVKDQYAKYLKNEGKMKFTHPSKPHRPKPRKDYLDHIESLEIVTSREFFYKDEQINIMLSTGADKYVNEQAHIYCYLNGKQFTLMVPTFSKGMITYKADKGDIKVGHYDLQFEYFDTNNNSIQSNIFAFDVLDEESDPNKPEKHTKVPNIEYRCNPEAELIMDIAKIESEGKVIVTYNNQHQLLYAEVYGKKAQESELKDLTDEYLGPTTLFALFMNEEYENLDNYKKNKIIINFIKAQLTQFNN